jgi:hypothetical protein
MNKTKATLKLLLVTISIISLSSSCKKDEPEPVVACNPHSNEAHNQPLAGTAYGNMMTNFWVKDKEYEGECSSKEISFTGIGHNSFGITFYSAPQYSEYTTETDPSNPAAQGSVTGAIVWSDGYDNFTLPSDPNTNYEVLSVTTDYLIVRTDDSPNVLRYKAKYE